MLCFVRDACVLLVLEKEKKDQDFPKIRSVYECRHCFPRQSQTTENALFQITPVLNDLNARTQAE